MVTIQVRSKHGVFGGPFLTTTHNEKMWRVMPENTALRRLRTSLRTDCVVTKYEKSKSDAYI